MKAIRLVNLFAFVLCLMATYACEKPNNEVNNNDGSEDIIIPDNEIWYTSTDGKKISFLHPDKFEQNPIISNIYENGKGVIKFQKSLTRIPEGAFECSLESGKKESSPYNLKSVQLPETVDTIIAGAFANCEQLEKIELPTSVSYIGDAAFCNTGIRSIRLPEGLEIIAGNMFMSCGYLSEVTLPKSVRRLMSYCFSVTGLKKIVIPEGVRSIGAGAFANSSLETIEFEGDLAYGTFGQNTFKNTRLKSIVIPGGISSLRAGSFVDCKYLKSVQIEEGVQSITGEFINCTALTEVTTPASLMYMTQSFSSCTALNTLNFKSSAPVDYKLESDMKSLEHIYVPKEAVNIYKEMLPDYARIIEGKDF